MGRPSGVQAGRRAGLPGVRRDAPGGRARLEAAVHDHAQPGAHVPHRPPELRARGAVSVRFLPAGDLAVLVEFDEEISVEVNTRVRALEFLIQQKGLTGVVETVPTFRSLLVYYDPRAVGYDAARASRRHARRRRRGASVSAARSVASTRSRAPAASGCSVAHRSTSTTRSRPSRFCSAPGTA